MREQSSITRADVEHVAALASLALTPEELERLGGDLRSMLGYVAELEEVDTQAIAPLVHVSELFRSQAEGAGALRADEPLASLLRAVVMDGAPATDGTFFKVPKVIER